MIGQTVSHYRIIRRLGGGGMGVVYEAEDVRLGRGVALKFLPESPQSDPNSLERFQREARATSLLNHPNICTIHDIAEFEGRPFIVMELLEGQSLKELLASRKRPNPGGKGPELVEPLPVDQILEIGVQVADALDVAHSVGIIHRDIKPGNIFITKRGQAKVLDFGLAKLAPRLLPAAARAPSGGMAAEGTEGGATATMVKDGSSSDVLPEDASGLTALGSIPGTVAYMSPEQVRSEELDARSDLFSFGVVLYEMATGQKPFTGTSTVLTMAAIIERKPISPTALNPALPQNLEVTIGKALEKPLEKRYQTAAELRGDLQRLKRESDSGQQALGAFGSSAKGVFRRKSSRAHILQLWSAGLFITIALVVTLWWATHSRVAPPASRNTIAVLPFQNMSPDKSDDFLRMALADEVTSILTYKQSLEVRPSNSVAKYAQGNPDPVQAGRELHVAAVVTGHFMHEGDKLSIILEAIDVKDNRLIWHGGITVPANNRLQMQQELKNEIRQELMPYVTGAASGAIETATRPQNAEAYDFFLRSVPVPHDPEPNREAIAMLERSVGLDPGYAPAWDALGLRYYFESTYGTGGGQMFDRANNAYERAVALDPNFLPAAVHLAINRVERGELAAAYQHARSLVARRSDNAQAHFALSYVLRYAGMLPEAARECDIAHSLDPGDYILRSCAQVFEELGQEDRALQFLGLDAGSQFYYSLLPRILLRKGDLVGARAAAEKVKNDETWYGGLLQSCLASDGTADKDKLDAQVRAALPQMLAQRDPEFHYDQGSMLVYCGQRQAAVSLLQAAISKNYCATEAFANDPALEKLRSYPEYEQLRAASGACLKKFLAARDQQAP